MYGEISEGIITVTMGTNWKNNIIIVSVYDDVVIALLHEDQEDEYDHTCTDLGIL